MLANQFTFSPFEELGISVNTVCVTSVSHCVNIKIVHTVAPRRNSMLSTFFLGLGFLIALLPKGAAPKDHRPVLLDYRCSLGRVSRK